MNAAAVLNILKEHQVELNKRGVKRIALFGSMARGEARPDSDVDILVDLDSVAALDVYDFVDLQQYIADLIATPVDVVNAACVKPKLRASIDRDSVYAF
ncbi:MAG: nucleotidyltransferase family protein [Hyphomicrobiaceae bacterium]